MSTEQTSQVFEHHGVALMSGDVDEVMKDYTDESVVITNLGGVVNGLADIRSMFEMPSPLSNLEVTTVHLDGEVAYVTWSADGIPFGTDTFIVRDGKILVQTVSFHFA